MSSVTNNSNSHSTNLNPTNVSERRPELGKDALRRQFWNRMIVVSIRCVAIAAISLLMTPGISSESFPVVGSFLGLGSRNVFPILLLSYSLNPRFIYNAAAISALITAGKLWVSGGLAGGCFYGLVSLSLFFVK